MRKSGKPSLRVYPVPQTFKVYKQSLPLSGRRFIKLESSHSDILSDALCRFAGQHGLDISYGKLAPEKTLIIVRLTASKSREAYEISSDEAGLLLTGGTEEALFRGLTSLSQILDQIDQDLPHLNITDKPDINERGIMLDISRGKVPKLDELKRMIDDFAKLKYNQLQLYTEHSFAFVNHPLVWADASPYTAQEILEIKSYCNARYIQLVPNLNCFGHFERWLRHPEYHKYAECPEGFTHPLTGRAVEFGSTLKPNKQSLKLIDELHAEYLPLFDSDYFNVGGDEPWELGEGWSKDLCNEQGSTNVYVDFIAEIQKLAEKRGRKMMFWSDIVLKQPASLKRLSKDLIAMNWGYEAKHPFLKECRQMAAQKIPFYVCPGTSSWNSLTGRTTNMIANILSAARNAVSFDAAGFLVTDWGDNGHHQYLPVSYPGFALGACASWNQKSAAKIDLIDLVNHIYFREDDANTATLLVEMGRVLDLAPSEIFNATIFNKLLFWDMDQEPSLTQTISDKQLLACETRFEALKHQLLTVTDKQVREELKTALDMALHSIHRVLHVRGKQQTDKNIDLASLRTELREIIGRHDVNWLARNRPGGLAESRAYFTRSLDHIK